MIETNVDDLSAQVLAFACERLLKQGALDAWLVPITMKKGRAAHTLKVLCKRHDLDSLCDVLFRETTTLGVRVLDVDRFSLRRRFESVEIEGLGCVRVKVGLFEDGTPSNTHPEYEDCKAVALRVGVPLKRVIAMFKAKAGAWSRKAPLSPP